MANAKWIISTNSQNISSVLTHTCTMQKLNSLSHLRIKIGSYGQELTVLRALTWQWAQTVCACGQRVVVDFPSLLKSVEHSEKHISISWRLSVERGHTCETMRKNYMIFKSSFILFSAAFLYISAFFHHARNAGICHLAPKPVYWIWT